ncbi:FkbM family methyltransferase [Bradyrhizobium erythrophlei]|uniref:Methyltransferase, FkbM family n=1 Tax=Bradyrhizobium erythrophlei TaxID=1437360 RepID=A0A1H5JDK0_9BRAD|nr:FkbM family methyltransferase [Bradyrhizobium erythrophlei]SEE50500.1 methyltransferase, FkbM family [Bradyrhizobium erythrophlei]
MTMFSALGELHRLGFNPSAILDIGAYTGEFSTAVRSIFPDAFILMIDALEENQGALADTSSRIGNAEYRHALLGETEQSQTPFYVVDTNMDPRLVKTGSSKYRENAVFPFIERSLTQTTLKSLVRPFGKRFSLVKLDVQGAELDVLRGFGDFISDIEAAVIELPIVEYNRGAPSIDQILSELRQMDLVLYDIVDEHRFQGNRLFQIDGLFVRSDSIFRPQPPFHG